MNDALLLVHSTGSDVSEAARFSFCVLRLSASDNASAYTGCAASGALIAMIAAIFVVPLGVIAAIRGSEHVMTINHPCICRHVSVCEYLAGTFWLGRNSYLSLISGVRRLQAKPMATIVAGTALAVAVSWRNFRGRPNEY